MRLQPNNIRNGAQSDAYHAARYASCVTSIACGENDALDAYDGSGCFMPEGGLSDEALAAVAWADFMESLQ